MTSTFQTLGRLGELNVESELIKRGWLVGNFNSNIKNAAVYDLFAVKNNHKKLIRVKSFRLDHKLRGNALYSAKKDGSVFLQLKNSNKDDYVVLAGLQNDKCVECYIVPTKVIDQILKHGHNIYIKRFKKDGSKVKDSTMRRLIFDGKRTSDRPNSGMRSYLSKYKDNWKILEK
jgi:hypothetical protein